MRVNTDLSPLDELIGQQLSAVTFVQDYIQVWFDGPGLNITNPLTVKAASSELKSWAPGFRDFAVWSNREGRQSCPPPGRSRPHHSVQRRVRALGFFARGRLLIAGSILRTRIEERCVDSGLESGWQGRSCPTKQVQPTNGAFGYSTLVLCAARGWDLGAVESGMEPTVQDAGGLCSKPFGVGSQR
jgi:hypothetical protein